MNEKDLEGMIEFSVLNQKVIVFLVSIWFRTVLHASVKLSTSKYAYI